MIFLKTQPIPIPPSTNGGDTDSKMNETSRLFSLPWTHYYSSRTSRWVVKGMWVVFLDWLITEWKWDRKTWKHKHQERHWLNGFLQVHSQTLWPGLSPARANLAIAEHPNDTEAREVCKRKLKRKKTRDLNVGLFAVSASQPCSLTSLPHMLTQGTQVTGFVDVRGSLFVLQENTSKESFSFAVLAAFSFELEVEHPSQLGNIFSTRTLSDTSFCSTFLPMKSECSTLWFYLFVLILWEEQANSLVGILSSARLRFCSAALCPWSSLSDKRVPSLLCENIFFLSPF